MKPYKSIRKSERERKGTSVLDVGNCTAQLFLQDGDAREMFCDLGTKLNVTGLTLPARQVSES